MELWKDIEGYEGHYQISNEGRVKSLIGWNGHKYVSREKILKPSLMTSGKSYKRYKITLSKNNKRTIHKIHRLVAIAFIPNPDNKPCVNHIDSSGLNNYDYNLEWVTVLENNMHSIIYGGRKPPYDYRQIIDLYEFGFSGPDIESISGIAFYTLYRILEKHSIKTRSMSVTMNKYNIPMDELLTDFIKGFRNIELAKKYNTNSNLIGMYRYKFRKKGLLL